MGSSNKGSSSQRHVSKQKRDSMQPEFEPTLARERRAARESDGVDAAHAVEEKMMDQNGMRHGVHSLLSSKLTRRAYAIFKHRLDKTVKQIKSDRWGGQQVKLPALFQVANLPDSMLNGRSNEWLEEAMQKIEKQLVEMILDAFEKEQGRRRPDLSTVQGFLDLLEFLPAEVDVSRKLKEYIVSADNDRTLQRVGLYGGKGVRLKRGPENKMSHAEVCGIYASLQCLEVEYNKVIKRNQPTSYTDTLAAWVLQCESYAVDLNLLENLDCTARTRENMQAPVQLLDEKDTSFPATAAHRFARGLGERISGIIYCHAAEHCNLMARVNDPCQDYLSQTNRRRGSENCHLVEVILAGIWPISVMVTTCPIEPGSDLRYDYGDQYYLTLWVCKILRDQAALDRDKERGAVLTVPQGKCNTEMQALADENASLKAQLAQLTQQAQANSQLSHPASHATTSGREGPTGKKRSFMGLGQDQDPDVGQDPDLGFANTDQQGRARERKLQRKASSICEAPSCVSGVLPVHGLTQSARHRTYVRSGSVSGSVSNSADDGAGWHLGEAEQAGGTTNTAAAAAAPDAATTAARVSAEAVALTSQHAAMSPVGHATAATQQTTKPLVARRHTSRTEAGTGKSRNGPGCNLCAYLYTGCDHCNPGANKRQSGSYPNRRRRTVSPDLLDVLPTSASGNALTNNRATATAPAQGPGIPAKVLNTVRHPSGLASATCQATASSAFSRQQVGEPAGLCNAPGISQASGLVGRSAALGESERATATRELHSNHQTGHHVDGIASGDWIGINARPSTTPAEMSPRQRLTPPSAPHISALGGPGSLIPRAGPAEAGDVQLLSRAKSGSISGSGHESVAAAVASTLLRVAWARAASKGGNAVPGQEEIPASLQSGHKSPPHSPLNKQSLAASVQARIHAHPGASASAAVRSYNVGCKSAIESALPMSSLSPTVMSQHPSLLSGGSVDEPRAPVSSTPPPLGTPEHTRMLDAAQAVAVAVRAAAGTAAANLAANQLAAGCVVTGQHTGAGVGQAGAGTGIMHAEQKGMPQQARNTAQLQPMQRVVESPPDASVQQVQTAAASTGAHIDSRHVVAPHLPLGPHCTATYSELRAVIIAAAAANHDPTFRLLSPKFKTSGSCSTAPIPSAQHPAELSVPVGGSMFPAVSSTSADVSCTELHAATLDLLHASAPVFTRASPKGGVMCVVKTSQPQVSGGVSAVVVAVAPASAVLVPKAAAPAESLATATAMAVTTASAAVRAPLPQTQGPWPLPIPSRPSAAAGLQRLQTVYASTSGQIAFKLGAATAAATAAAAKVPSNSSSLSAIPAITSSDTAAYRAAVPVATFFPTLGLSSVNSAAVTQAVAGSGARNKSSSVSRENSASGNLCTAGQPAGASPCNSVVSAGLGVGVSSREVQSGVTNQQAQSPSNVLSAVRGSVDLGAEAACAAQTVQAALTTPDEVPVYLPAAAPSRLTQIGYVSEPPTLAPPPAEHGYGAAAAAAGPASEKDAVSAAATAASLVEGAGMEGPVGDLSERAAADQVAAAAAMAKAERRAAKAVRKKAEKEAKQALRDAELASYGDLTSLGDKDAPISFD